MGCDIHAHTEILVETCEHIDCMLHPAMRLLCKEKHRMVWEHYGHPIIQRDYRLFARMASVRQGDPNGTEGGLYERRRPWIEPISKPRGLPSDASFTTFLDAQRYDRVGHSHSWLNGREISQLAKWFDDIRQISTLESFEHKTIGYLFNNGWESDDVPAMVKAARMVFWFDN
jgi:hypothetical protein